MKKINLFGLFLALIAMTSCGEDTSEKKEYKNGVIVVNQGVFGSGTGTLTFKERNQDSVYQDIFTNNNEGAFLGNVAQSMIEHDDKNYIAVNNAASVMVTDKDDLSLITTITDVAQRDIGDQVVG